MLFQIFADPCGEPALQRCLVLQAKRLDPRLYCLVTQGLETSIPCAYI